jgi:non-homologous end joining protein Ku
VLGKWRARLSGASLSVHSLGAARRHRSIRAHQDGLLLQRLYFADEVQNAGEIDRGAEPKIRDQERTLAERLISELSGTEFRPENYEDEYRKRLLKAIEQKVAGQEIQQIEVEARAPTTDLVATLTPRSERPWPARRVSTGTGRGGLFHAAFRRAGEAGAVTGSAPAVCWS